MVEGKSMALYSIVDGEDILPVDDKVTVEELSEELAYILVSHHTKQIYIWIGPQAGVQYKFVAAQEAQKFRMEFGYHVANVDADDSISDFQSALNLDFNSPESAAPISSETPRAGSSPPSLSELKRSSKKGRENISKSTSTPASKKNYYRGSSSGSMHDKHLDSPGSSSSLSNRTIERILKTLSSESLLDGHVRDYLIINDQIFQTPKQTMQLKPDDLVATSLGDGTFVAESYTPRIFIKLKDILCIEMWRIES